MKKNKSQKGGVLTEKPNYLTYNDKDGTQSNAGGKQYTKMTPDSRHSKLKIQQKLRKKHADTVESAKRQQITSSNDTKEIMAQRQKLRPF